MKRRAMWMSLVAAGAMTAGCQSDGARIGQESNVQFAIAALEVPGPADTASYSVKIEVFGGGEGDFTLFQEFEVDAAEGSGGASQFVGTCQASDDGTAVLHRATITLNSAKDADGNSLLDGCEGEYVQERYFDCFDGGDTRVAAAFHLMCDIDRGFTDITFEVDNYYCQTKIDCPTDPLLYNPEVGARGRGLVIGNACRKDTGEDVDFAIPVFVSMRCSDGGAVPLNQDRSLDVAVEKNAAFYAERYVGSDLIDGTGFNNLVFSLYPEAFAGAKTCEVDVYTTVVDTTDGVYEDKLLQEGAVIHMKTTLEIGEDDVTCGKAEVITEVMPVTKLEAGTDASGNPQLNAFMFQFAKGERAIEEECFVAYQKGDEANDGWGNLQSQVRELQVVLQKDRAELIKVEASLAELNAQAESVTKEYNEAIGTLTADQATADEAASEFTQFINGRFTQNNMNSEERALCDVYGELKNDFANGSDVAALKNALLKHRQIALASAIADFGRLAGWVDATDEAVQRLADYGGHAEPLRKGYDAVTKGLNDHSVAVRTLEEGILRGLESQAITDGLDSLATDCGALGAEVNEFVGSIGKVRNEINNTIQGLTAKHVEFTNKNEAEIRRNGETRAKIEDGIRNLGDEIAEKAEMAGTLYEAMSDECNRSDEPLRIWSGTYSTLQEASALNLSDTLIGSQAGSLKETAIVSFCETKEDAQIVFNAGGKSDYHGMSFYRDAGAYMALSLPGKFAVDTIAEGLPVKCGPTFEATNRRQ